MFHQRGLLFLIFCRGCKNVFTFFCRQLKQTNKPKKNLMVQSLKQFWPYCAVYHPKDDECFPLGLVEEVSLFLSLPLSLFFLLFLTRKEIDIWQVYNYHFSARYWLGNQHFVKRSHYIRINNPLHKKSEKLVCISKRDVLKLGTTTTSMA